MPLPIRPMAALAGAWSRLGLPPRLSAEQVLRLAEDKAFSYESARRDWGYSPRGWREGLTAEVRLLRDAGSLVALGRRCHRRSAVGLCRGWLLLRSGKKRREGACEEEAGLLLRALVQVDRVDEVLVRRLQGLSRPGLEIHELQATVAGRCARRARCSGSAMRASTKGLSVKVGR